MVYFTAFPQDRLGRLHPKTLIDDFNLSSSVSVARDLGAPERQYHASHLTSPEEKWVMKWQVC